MLQAGKMLSRISNSDHFTLKGSILLKMKATYGITELTDQDSLDNHAGFFFLLKNKKKILFFYCIFFHYHLSPLYLLLPPRSPSLPQSPHCCPCPLVSFSFFCLIPPPPASLPRAVSLLATCESVCFAC